MNAILSLTSAGPGSFDLYTRTGGYAGLIASRNDGTYRVYFDSNASRGSACKFANLTAALEYIIARRIKKGWRV